MLIRILGEGQYEIPDAALAELNRLDAALEAALKTPRARRHAGARRAARLRALHRRTAAGPRARESDVILPFADASEDDIRACSPRKASSPD